MFKEIYTIEDVQPFVADKKEIRFTERSNGITVGCYEFMDSKTFDSPEALECRGIAFDQEGIICSRPLHKFFNVGEKEWLSPDALLARNDIVGIYEKLDGSMIATAWVNDNLEYRSKKAFDSDVARMALDFSNQNILIDNFAYECAEDGLTAIFELTHPDARIVVEPDKPRMRLLHVRDNETGEYVMLNRAHYIHDLIRQYAVPIVNKYNGTLAEAIASLETMGGQEGYVIQFANGDMAKMKCPWYTRLHKSITFLRERDIALLALNEELDDVKASLVEAGIDLSAVNMVESQVKAMLVKIMDSVDEICEEGRSMSRKDFAIAHKGHMLFGLLMASYGGQDVDVREWYRKHRLKEDFTLRQLVNGAKAEAIAG